MEFAQKLLSTRRGTFLVAAIAAILAFSTLLVYLNRYRESLNQAAQPTTVLVAKNLIPRGLSGDVVASQDMFQTRELTKGQLKEGAIGDPAVLKGRVAVADLYPGQQLTVSDFSTTAVPALSASLTGDQRAIAVPLDEAHGAYAQVKTGDYVDVIGAFSVKKGNDTFPVAKTIMDDVLVLSTPADPNNGFSGGKGASLIVRATDQQAATLAFATENGSLWIALRPRTGATPTHFDFVTLQTLLLGIAPVNAYRQAGGKE